MRVPSAVYLTNNRQAFDRNFEKDQRFTTLDLLQGAVEFFPDINSFLVVVFDPAIKVDELIYEG